VERPFNVIPGNHVLYCSGSWCRINQHRDAGSWFTSSLQSIAKYHGSAPRLTVDLQHSMLWGVAPKEAVTQEMYLGWSMPTALFRTLYVNNRERSVVI
jgi:hypothetical protein